MTVRAPSRVSDFLSTIWALPLTVKTSAAIAAKLKLKNLYFIIPRFKLRRVRARPRLLSRYRDAENAPGVRVCESVAHELNNAFFHRTAVRTFLTRTLIGTETRSLVHFGSGIPELEEVRNVAGDGIAVRVEELDRLFRRVKQIVRLSIHKCEIQLHALIRGHFKLERAAREDRRRRVLSNGFVEDAGVDPADF